MKVILNTSAFATFWIQVDVYDEMSYLDGMMNQMLKSLVTCSSACASMSLTPPPYAISNCVDTAPAGGEVPWVQFTIPNATCEDRVEEIYEDLCYVKFTSAMPEVAPDIIANAASYPPEIIKNSLIYWRFQLFRNINYFNCEISNYKGSFVHKYFPTDTSKVSANAVLYLKQYFIYQGYINHDL